MCVRIGHKYAGVVCVSLCVSTRCKYASVVCEFAGIAREHAIPYSPAYLHTLSAYLERKRVCKYAGECAYVRAYARPDLPAC